jgi:hypothetical protein
MSRARCGTTLCVPGGSQAIKRAKAGSGVARGGAGSNRATKLLLLTHALAQPLKLRSYMLAGDFFLEPGDRPQGGIFPQTRQTLCVPRT